VAGFFVARGHGFGATSAREGHLTQSQKAAVATESLPLFEAEAKERARIAPKNARDGKEIIPDQDKGQARDKAAAAVGVNPRYVSDAKKIKEESPETFQKVETKSRPFLSGLCVFPNWRRI
jgi:hypothetical protein